MSDDMIWENPPRDRPGRGAGSVDHAKAAALLRSRPGRWGVVGEYANGQTSATIAWLIRRGERLLAYAPKGDFQAMARSVDTIENGERVRHFRVYARYVGFER